MHVRLSNVFDHHGNIKIPSSNRLVVWRCNESPIFVHKGYCVDWTEMLIVFLSNLAWIDVVLCNPRVNVRVSSRIREHHLYNLFVRHSSKEDILFVLVRMKANNVRNLPIAESFDTLACFRIPQLHLTIVCAGKKPPTIVGKSDILYGFDMSVERPKTVSMIIYVPKLWRSEVVQKARQVTLDLL